MLIYINPGHNVGIHGQRDPGAVGKKGLTEAEVSKDMAKRVCHLLREKGLNTDTAIQSFADAARDANNAHADLCVSIHCNASMDASAHGTEVWYQGMQSEALATCVLQQVIHQVHDGHSTWLEKPVSELIPRGIKDGTFYILRETKMPCVLVELAFISNLHEEELLRDAHFRQAMAQAIADGIQTYLSKER